MVFGYLTDSIENVLDVVDGVMDGEAPTKRQVAKLIDSGLSVAAIAVTFGVAESVITDMMDDS